MPTFALHCAPPSLALRLHCTVNAPLPLTISKYYESIASVLALAPLNFRRNEPRLVSYYALFQGWLLLSQPPSCLWSVTSFPTQAKLGDLSLWSGLFPFRHMELIPHGLTRVDHRPGIRSLTRCDTFRRRNPISALPPGATTRLYLNIFRGEPAISGFDRRFTTTHRSSPSFARLVGSDLLPLLSGTHPAHGWLTRFRVV